MRVEKEKWDICCGEKVLLTFMQPESRQVWWFELCK